MIRVDITMVPGGVGTDSHMATILIANDVAESWATRGRTGAYVASFSRISQHGEHLGLYSKMGTVSGINRRTSGAVYRILHGVLADFLGERT